MPENPYQSPSSPRQGSDTNRPVNLEERLTQYRRRQRRWSINCWAVGMGAVSAGIGVVWMAKWLNLSESWQGSTLLISVLATSLFVVGTLIIALGPIAWFWVYPSR